MELQPRCKCGHQVDENDGPEVLTTFSHDKDQIDEEAASFVHLTSHKNDPSSESDPNWNTLGIKEYGSNQMKLSSTVYNEQILSQHHHINTLLKLSEEILDIKDQDSTDIQDLSKSLENLCLCQKCILRISAALDQNIEIMQKQINAYESAIEQEKENDRRFQKAVSITLGTKFESDASEGIFKSLVQDKINNLKEECMSLDLRCKEQEAELEEINIMFEGQIELSKELTSQEDQLLQDLHAIEIDNKAFHTEHRQLTIQCYEAERERYFLEHVSLHTAMYNIIVDSCDGSQLYPLINGLRLTYRPKGDIKWTEINAAWSQAVQLVMCIASSIQFQSNNIRIVPLVSCSKIIRITKTLNGAVEKTVYNLGVEKEKADNKLHEIEHIIDGITAFHSLVYQVMVYAQRKMDSSGLLNNIPYDMSEHEIGGYITQNNDYDNYSKWSGVVHAIACNLKWLSDHVKNCN